METNRTDRVRRAFNYWTVLMVAGWFPCLFAALAYVMLSGNSTMAWLPLVAAFTPLLIGGAGMVTTYRHNRQCFCQEDFLG